MVAVLVVVLVAVLEMLEMLLEAPCEGAGAAVEKTKARPWRITVEMWSSATARSTAELRTARNGCAFVRDERRA